MNKFFKFSKLLLLLLFLYSCGSVGEALQGKKRSDQGDEFLIDKKNPKVGLFDLGNHVLIAGFILVVIFISLNVE